VFRVWDVGSGFRGVGCRVVGSGFNVCTVEFLTRICKHFAQALECRV